MKYIEEFRQGHLAEALAKAIAAEARPEKSYQLMEFCGGHTHTLHRYGLPGLLPENVEMIHGPGCPVCVLPIARVDKALALARMPNLILCSYGDMLRVPGSGRQNLLKAKALGAEVRMVYSALDAVELAKQHPDKEVVFFAIGFETTTPATAHAILKARELKLPNFSVFCNHVLTPPAMDGLLQIQDQEQAILPLDGFVGPAHVSIVIGASAYAEVAARYRKPIVISGFEPLDVLHSILMLIRQINAGKAEVEIQYTRAVNAEGNLRSQAMMAEVFSLREEFEWRGLGMIPQSALQIKPEFAAFDAELRFDLPESQGEEHQQCECANVLRGLVKPQACKLFAKVCTPENPLGACMVSSEGACAAVYAYGRGI